jgi:hypothetical protein
MYNVLLLDEIFCRHQLGPFDLWCHLVLRFLLIFCLDDLSMCDKIVLKSPITTVLKSICAFKTFRVRLMKLGVLGLGSYRLIIVTFFGCIAPFIMKCPIQDKVSSSCLTNVSLTSILSDISIITPTCFQGPLAW